MSINSTYIELFGAHVYVRVPCTTTQQKKKKEPPASASKAHGPEAEKGYIGFRVYGIHWGHIGIVEKKMETTIMGLYRVEGLGYLLGLYRDNEKEHGNYIMRLYRV